MAPYPNRKGSRNPHAILNGHQVRHILNMSTRKGNRRGWQSRLAEKYGVSRKTISDIVNGKRWQ